MPIQQRTSSHVLVSRASTRVAHAPLRSRVAFRASSGDDVRAGAADDEIPSIVDAPTARAASAAVLALIDRLLPDGRDVNARDPSNGETALTVCAEKGDARDVRTLIAAGADVRSASDSGWTAAHGAAECGSIECLVALLDAGADPSAVAASGKTPMDIARQYGKPEAEAFLRQRGARWGIYDEEKEEEEEEEEEEEARETRAGFDDPVASVSDPLASSDVDSSSPSPLEALLARHLGPHPLR